MPSDYRRFVQVVFVNRLSVSCGHKVDGYLVMQWAFGGTCDIWELLGTPVVGTWQVLKLVHFQGRVHLELRENSRRRRLGLGMTWTV